MFLLIAIFLFAVSNTFSQSDAPLMGGGTSQVILRGIVINEFDSKPVEAEIELKPKKGNKIKINSNSLTGKFEQLLSAEEQYEVTVNSDKILRKVFDLTTIKGDKQLSEQKIDVKVKVLSKGLVISQHNIFAGDVISPQGKKELNEIKKTLRFNRAINVDLEFSAPNPNSATARMEALKKELDGFGVLKDKITLKNVNGSSDITLKVNEILDLFK